MSLKRVLGFVLLSGFLLVVGLGNSACTDHDFERNANQFETINSLFFTGALTTPPAAAGP
ncbi:MAG TPA: hypothetical protein V6D17_03105 [Candidatus Obscuribacterales bacterium]